MNISNKKYLFINGTSISAGGGFEEYQYRKDVRDLYQKKGIDLPKNQIECTYGYHLSKILNLKLINKSKSGSGIDRLIRTTFDWIFKNEDKLNETIFVLEIQSGIRLDWYVREWDTYGIVNAAMNEQGEFPFTLVNSWFIDDKYEQNEWNEKYYNTITDWFNNFFNIDEHFNNELIKTICLISFLKLKNIDFIISYHKSMGNTEAKKIENLLKNENILSDVLDGEINIWEYCKKNKQLISDEVESDDFHIGFYGNKEVAEKISKKFN